MSDERYVPFDQDKHLGEPLADLILGSEWLEQKLRDSYYEGWSKGWDDCVAARKAAHEGAA